MSKVRLIHQIDAYKGEIVGEHWLVDGINYREGKELETVGFKYIRGLKGPGAWRAPNKEAVQVLIDGNIEIINTGNGHDIEKGQDNETLDSL